MWFFFTMCSPQESARVKPLNFQVLCELGVKARQTRGTLDPADPRRPRPALLPSLPRHVHKLTLRARALPTVVRDRPRNCDRTVSLLLSRSLTLRHSAPANRVRPISLLTLSLLPSLESNFPRKSLGNPYGPGNSTP